ncbi:hypothetical protein SSPO_080030 [Streptomyces antimycoticus]|uniref:Uncharacterized protein n=1 Tax=Streptomyces antimycoticus TaxID=68175 RepID=A0A499UT13_9ACTN|nr:hypothetical protein SSPO_080030 [Streptomyces antimycoticus]
MPGLSAMFTPGGDRLSDLPTDLTGGSMVTSDRGPEARVTSATHGAISATGSFSHHPEIAQAGVAAPAAFRCPACPDAVLGDCILL